MPSRSCAEPPRARCSSPLPGCPAPKRGSWQNPANHDPDRPSGFTAVRGCAARCCSNCFSRAFLGEGEQLLNFVSGYAMSCCCPAQDAIHGAVLTAGDSASSPVLARNWQALLACLPAYESRLFGAITFRALRIFRRELREREYFVMFVLIRGRAGSLACDENRGCRGDRKHGTRVLLHTQLVHTGTLRRRNQAARRGWCRCAARKAVPRRYGNGRPHPGVRRLGI